MLLPDEKGVYSKRFPRPDEVREARIVEAMEMIVERLGPGGCAGQVIDDLFKDDIIRRLNYAGWDATLLQGNRGYYSITPKETR